MAISNNRVRRIVEREDELDYGLNEVVSIDLRTLTLLSLLSETEYHFIAHSNLEWAGTPYLVWRFNWMNILLMHENGIVCEVLWRKAFASRGNSHCKDCDENVLFTYSRNSKELLSSGEWARVSRKSEMVLKGFLNCWRRWWWWSLLFSVKWVSYCLKVLEQRTVTY